MNKVCGNLVGELRKAGITQTQLAKAMGISRRSIFMKINGDTEFKASEMFFIKKTFFPNLTLEELFSK